MTPEEVLRTVYYLLLLTGFLILIVRRRKLGSIFYVFLPLYFFNVASQITVEVLIKLGSNPFPPLHINQFIGSFLLHTYYYLTLRNKWNKAVVIAGFLSFTYYFVHHFLYLSGNLQAREFSDFTLEGLFVCIFSVLYLLELYRQDNIDLVSKNPHFWLSVGNLIFFSGCMFVMGLLDYLHQYSTELYTQLS